MKAYTRLRELAPELARLFLWTQEVIGTREVGFRQGDPASTTNASLSLEDTLDRVQEALREEQSRLRDDGYDFPDGQLVAFADDGNILTTLGVAVKLAGRIPELYAEDQLEVVLKKSYIISRFADEAEGWHVTRRLEKNN